MICSMKFGGCFETKCTRHNLCQLLTEKVIQGAIGTRGQSDAIEEHMKEYFKRWPNYKDRFTYLEWYHIFLDFYDKLIKDGKAT